MEYNFREIEKKWHQKWVENKTYKVTEDENKKKFYVLNMFPYPSGKLHMGHALDHTLQDVLIRWKRMDGYEALWQPGTDHASIATEVKVVEKIRKEGMTKILSLYRELQTYDKINTIKKYIREQETEDMIQDKRSVKEYEDPFKSC